jgi:hypothetical protein
MFGVLATGLELWVDDSGQDVAEYAVMLAVILGWSSYIDVGHAFIVHTLNLPRIHGRSFSETRVCTWRHPTSIHRVCRTKDSVSG